MYQLGRASFFLKAQLRNLNNSVTFPIGFHGIIQYVNDILDCSFVSHSGYKLWQSD